jgi:hypothetical protein
MCQNVDSFRNEWHSQNCRDPFETRRSVLLDHAVVSANSDGDKYSNELRGRQT